MSTYRQIYHGISIMLSGAINVDEMPVEEAINCLVQLASDWAENLPDDSAMREAVDVCNRHLFALRSNTDQD